MQPIRILIVDDSVVIRRILSDALSTDPDLTVVATAATGRLGLTKIEQLHPDLVTLDIDMPDMNGLETLRAIRKKYPRLPVIMVSSLTSQGAATTLEALALGASDYVAKPPVSGTRETTLALLRRDLITKAKALVMPLLSSPSFSLTKPATHSVRPAPEILVPNRIDLIAIGSSTGGPNALLTLFRQLPADFPTPIVVVQHMSAMFTKLLAQQLAAKSPLPIAEGGRGVALTPGHIWIAPGDFHLTVERIRGVPSLLTHQRPPENSCRPSVDVLFRSVATTCGSHALAVVLTGMGQDGLQGCKAIRNAGGQVLVQDEATSVVWGMPGFVARAGLAHKVLPLDHLAGEILRRVRVNRAPRTEVAFPSHPPPEGDS